MKALASLLMGLLVAQGVAALGLSDRDSRGNVNQVNIGVGKTNRLDDSAPRENNRQTEREWNVGPFSSLAVHVPADLVYTQGAPNRVRISGPAAALQAIRIREQSGHLVIDSPRGFSASGRIDIEVSGTSVDEVELSGALDAQLRRINRARFKVAMSGAVTLSGSGRAGHCVLEVSGSGDADLEELHCDLVDLRAGGSSDLSLHADKRIAGSVSGASDVTVHGNPGKRQLTAGGAADINYY